MAQILIADDDPTQGNVLAHLLAQTPGLDLTDVELVRAAEARAAIASISETDPSVVIVALTGSGTRALALCQAVRQSPSATTTRIAVVGGKIPDPEVLRQIEHDFAARFFAQPFELSQLSSYVATALGRPVSSGNVTRLRPTTSFGAGDEGELAHRRLPAVLLDLLESGDSGLLRLARGKVEKVVSIIDGQPCSVRSNAREETLGQFLLDQRIIDSRAHSAAIRQASSSRRRIGAVLVALGAITQAQLASALSAQVRFKLIRSLRWPDGSWQFEPRKDVFNSSGEVLDVESLVLRALCESVRLSPLPRHLQAIRDSSLRVGTRARRLAPQLEAIYGGELIVAAFGPAEIKVADLLTEGFARANTYSLIDTLWHIDALTTLAGEDVPDAREVESITVAELSEQSHRRATSNGEGTPLWDVLFADGGVEFAPQKTGSVSLLAAVSGEPPRAESEFGEQRTELAPKSAPNEMLEIYLRVQGNDHYKVVGADERAESEQIEQAIAQTEAELARSGILDPNEKLPLARVVRDSFERARDVLLDPEKRATYDSELRGTRNVDNDPIRAELAFGRALEAINSEQWPIAVRELHAAVEAAPHEATYRAELGWCHYLKGHRAPRAADQARPHLNQALAIDYDHAAAHENKGLISADLGSDDVEAIFHLRRALDGDSTRPSALERLEKLYQQRGELRALERQYRRLIQLATGTPQEADLWLRMGRLYQTQLDDRESAEIAFSAARQLAPVDPNVIAALTDKDGAGVPSFEEKSAPLIERWLALPYDPTHGKNLLSLAIQCGAHDHAFVAASLLVALGADDVRAEKLYRRFRPRFVVRAQARLEGNIWKTVADNEDNPTIAQLLSLLAPVVHRHAPVSLADLEVGERERIADEDLPGSFVRVRNYVGHMLAVDAPPVYVRSDFEQQVHIGGLQPPVLLVGEDVLVTPERLELAFRLGRAMTYLPGGRRLGGSHSGTLLKKVVLAAFYVTHPETPRGELDPSIRPFISDIERLDASVLRRLDELMVATASSNPNLNLSGWKNALARTADRVGLVLCGDFPSSLRFARDTGAGEADVALLRFAIRGGFSKARALLGLSIDV